MYDSSALSKIRSIILIAIIVIASAIGILYFLLEGQSLPSNTIKIGVCADIDASSGRGLLQEVLLAVEHINAEGGVLGKQFEVVSQDDDSESGSFDVSVATNALTRLIAVDKADYLISSGIAFSSIYQEIAFQYKKILFDAYSMDDDLTQKVLDNYDRYKYYFRVGISNSTTSTMGVVDSIGVMREHTGFNKVALISHDFGLGELMFSLVIDGLQELGIEVVYTANIPLDTIDFSSYFTQAESAGAEMLYSMVLLGQAGIPFVNEYRDRQSPMVLWGVMSIISPNDFWELTEGKCEYVCVNAYPTAVGYPLTNKTLSFRESYLERWGEMSNGAIYDAVRYILIDAIKRAGTFETEDIILALEETNVETSLARHFVFTSSHDVLIGAAGPNKLDEDYLLICIFQWQNGTQVPVYPMQLFEEAEVSYVFPPWPGPWDDID